MQKQLCLLVYVFHRQEIISLKASSALWCMYTAEAPLHCDGVYGKWLPP